MKHIDFTLCGEEMHIFESFPYSIITDCDGTEIVYIRRQIHDDTLCDVLYVARRLYPFVNWTFEELEKFVEAYCINNLGRKISTTQSTNHLVLPSLDISEFDYTTKGLRKLRG